MSFTQTESNRKIHKLLVRKDPEISSIMFLSMMKKKRSKKKKKEKKEGFTHLVTSCVHITC